MKDRIKNIALIALVVAAGILLLLLKCQRDNAANLQNMLDAQSDTLQTTRNELGQQTAQILAFEASRQSFLNDLETKDSTIQQLQHIVKEKDARMAAILATETSDTGTTPTEITTTDTVKNDSVHYVYPTYRTEWDKKWSMGEIIANRDSIMRKFQFRNRLEMWHSYESDKSGLKKLFGPKKLTFFAKNKNPNTMTTEARSYSVKVDQKNWFGVGVHAGYGYGLRSQQFGPYVGIGVQLPIISF